ncbi:type IV secretory system conjugative DNA transfer family protein [Mameliella alba]|uniref:type IV secretory system conjugative DNA transfer family protein n=1 Tax=Mameliella alba TaxID=561184 RepID=UPI000B5324DB|nr:type IV secretory system conjugative DNA transfer family protein [Mameliella alba]OWV37832.1 type VI secretion protein [Mameliella alba]
MGKGKLAVGVVLVTLVAMAIGYVIASAVLTFRDVGFQAEIDFFYIARNYLAIRAARSDDFRLINLIMGGAGVAGLLMSLAMSGSALTRFGYTHWQTRREMRRNGFFGAPGTGFVIGKLGKPGSRAPFLCSRTFPHALIVAPTGRGKTTGFVIPNLLTWQGAAVVLDVKGECFEATARHRAAQGDAVFRFAPTDWEDKRTHRYNPLLRIYELEDPARQQMELQLLATLFLQNDNDRVQGLLKGGIDLFVAAGLLAFQRRRPTLGEIYRIAASGGQKQKEYLARAHEVQNAAARLIFTRLASTNNDTLTSYVSLLMTSGLDQWQNPAIDDATAVSDFDFRTIRKKPFSVYLVVQPLMVKPLAPLIRLFFSDLLSALQDKEPGPDEPWPVMIMLDEFNRLGKMPIVAESIEVLRHYRGHLAVVTQTIPAIDEIYGENTRRALQGNAGIKLYLTPSDEKTVEELSKAVGKTTKTVVTRSRAVGKNPFEGRSQSERTEEVSLLPEDEARRLPLDEIVVVVDAQMPVRAKRVVYFEDPFFKGIHAAQEGEFPFPKGPVPPMGELPLSVRAMPTAPRGSGLTERDFEARMGLAEAGGNLAVNDAPAAAPRPVRAAVLADEQRQMEMDFGGQEALKLDDPNERDKEQIERALSDLERLQGEMTSSAKLVGEAGEKLEAG